MSRRRLGLILGLVGLLLLAALGADAFVFGGFPLPASLTDVTWTLASYSSDSVEVPFPTGTPATLRFQRVGHDFSGSDGCNDYFGKAYSLWPERISLGNLGQTTRECPGSMGTFEANYLADLVAVDSYHISSGGLVLRGDGGRLAMGFTAGGA